MSGVPRVVAIRPHVVRAHVPDDLGVPVASFVSDGAVLLEVVTDEGLVGWGEPSPYGAPLPDLLAALDAIAPTLIGAGIDELGPMLAAVTTEGVHRYGHAARGASVAGLAQAAWDLRGKHAGRPAAALIAEAMGLAPPEPGTTVATYASAGMFHEDAPDSAWVDEALALRARGHTAYKLRPPTPRGAGSHFARTAAPPAVDVARLVGIVAAVRSAVGDTFGLMLDVGRRIPDVDTAATLADGLAPLDVTFLEEPLAGPLEDHVELRRRTDVPIAGGEQHADAEELARWLDHGALDVVQPDAGFTGIDGIVHLVRRDPDRVRSTLVPHSWANPVCIAANVHVAAAVGARLIEANETFNPMRTALVTTPHVPVDGRVTLTDRPGLGVEVDRDALAAFG